MPGSGGRGGDPRALEDQATGRQYFPSLLEDETLYSWCARYASLNLESYQRCVRRLFGSGQFLSPHYASNLTRFCESGHFRALHPEILAFLHSNVGYLTQLLGSSSRDKVLAALRRPCSGHALRAEFLLPPELGCIRLCQECVRTEMAKSGIAHWKVSDMYPTSWYCSVHGTMLHPVSPSEAISFRRRFYLPSQFLGVALNGSVAPPPQGQEHLRQLSALTQSIMATPPREPSGVYLALTIAAARKGWIDRCGVLRRDVISKSCTKFLGSADPFLGLALKKIAEGVMWPIDVLCKVRQGPSRHLSTQLQILYIYYFFVNFESFQTAYNTAMSKFGRIED